MEDNFWGFDNDQEIYYIEYNVVMLDIDKG